MSANLVEIVRQQLNGHVDDLSRTLGLPVDTVRTGVEKITPLLLGGFVQKLLMPEGVTELSEWLGPSLSRAGAAVGVDRRNPTGANDLATQVEQGTTLLETLFGRHMNDIIQSLTSPLALEPSTIHKLLALVGPVMIKILTQQLPTAPKEASGWLEFAATHRTDIIRALPARTRRLLQTVAEPTIRSAVRKLAPVLAVMILGLILWRLFRTDDAPQNAEPFPDDAELEIDLPE